MGLSGVVGLGNTGIAASELVNTIHELCLLFITTSMTVTESKHH